MDKKRTIVCQSLSWPSTVVNVHEIDETINGHGLAVGKTDMDLPFAIEYDISISAHWDVEEMVIKSRLDGNMIKIVHTDDAWYDHLDQHLAEFDNIEIVDISISPFTNTLPIKKLHLENGEPQKVDVIYFDENQFSLRKVPQIYSQIDNRIYRYQDVELPAFVSDIEVDDEGMVVELPKLFRRV